MHNGAVRFLFDVLFPFTPISADGFEAILALLHIEAANTGGPRSLARPSS